jgi:hypothetical protein
VTISVSRVSHYATKPITLRIPFGSFYAPLYFVPNSFMHEVRDGRVDVADYHEAECDIDSSCEEVNYGEV